MNLTFLIRTTACLLAAFLLCQPVAYGQEEADTTVVLPEVVVFGDARLFPATSRRIHRVDLRPSDASSFRSLAEILEESGAVHIQRAGWTGVATASLRGAGAEHTPVVLDGFRLADPQTGQIDLSMIPPGLVDRVEIVHGPSEAASGLGGALLMQARNPSDVGHQVGVTAGAFGRRSTTAAVSGSRGMWSGSISGLTSRVDGAYEYTNEATFPATEMQRHGAGRQTLSMALSGRRQAETRSVSALLWAAGAVRGVPGPANTPDVRALQRDRLVRAQISFVEQVQSGLLGPVHLEFGAAHTTTMLRYRPDTETAPGQAGSGRRDEYTGRTTAVRAAFTATPAPSWLLSSSLTAASESAALNGSEHRVVADGLLAAYRMIDSALLGARLGATLHESAPGRSRLALLPEVSADLPISETASTVLALRASAARAFRRPTLNELYWQPGGNPDLKAEEGWMSDAGIRLDARVQGVSVELDAGVFAGVLENKIVWHPSLAGAGVRIWRPVNVGRARHRGVEGGLRVGIATGMGRWSVDLNGTYTTAEDRSDPEAPSFGHQLRYAPAHTGRIGLSWTDGRWAASVGVQTMGRRYLASDESRYLDGFAVASADLGRTITLPEARIHLRLAVENATDTSYEIMRLYPMPPRHVVFSIHFIQRDQP